MNNGGGGRVNWLVSKVVALVCHAPGSGDCVNPRVAGRSELGCLEIDHAALGQERGREIVGYISFRRD
jgi:hypothetical protein